MKIINDIYEKMLSCETVPPETGGIIGCKNDIVCAFEYDKGTNITDRAVYIPNICKMNARIKKWEKEQIVFCGIAHSHLISQPALSSDDISYIKVIMDTIPKRIESLFFPIILPKVDIVSYKAIRNKNGIDICEDEIKII